jgi:hypothetical protein
MEAIIVGAGIIGTGTSKDFIKPYFSSHYEEYKKKGIAVTWIIDPDKRLVRDVANKLQVENTASKLTEVNVSSNKIFISICSPTSSHFKIFKQVLKQFPKKELKIWLEKPSSNVEEDYEEMEFLSKQASCEVLVNYPRRYDQNFKLVHSEIQTNKIQKIFLRYTKGSFHNLPHFINILHWYCGSLSKIQYSQLTTRKEYTDVDGLYFFGTTPVIISSLDYQLFDHYELDIVLNNKMFRFHDGGLELEEFIASNRFSRASNFLQKNKIYPSVANEAMGIALDALIAGGSKIHTSISNDYNIYQDIKKILNRSHHV